MPVRTGLKFANNPGDPWNVEKVVQELEKEPAPTGQIVFYGPSNFTRWGAQWGMIPLREALVGQSGAPCAINRGFGSSNAELQLYYYPRMVRPLAPKVLVYACWGNEYSYTDEETWEIAQRVVAYALADFPGIHVYLHSANPRREMSEAEIERRRKVNGWMKEFAENTPDCFYLDTFEYEPLRNPDLFVKDGIHFNQQGYLVYGEFFKEALKDELANY